MKCRLQQSTAKPRFFCALLQTTFFSSFPCMEIVIFCSIIYRYFLTTLVQVMVWRSRQTYYLKNIERHTAHTIVSWLNPKKWVIVHISDLIMIIRQSIYILSIITRAMGKLKTHSPTRCIMDDWENMFYLTHSTKYIWQAFYKFTVFR